MYRRRYYTIFLVIWEEICYTGIANSNRQGDRKTMEGKFIVIEGLDGSGKSTQIRLLAERLRSLGREVFETAEPTPSATGGLIRDALSGFTRRTGAEIAALFMADRVAHNVNPINGINVMLAQGRDVICDRYYYSSLAYQGREE